MDGKMTIHFNKKCFVVDEIQCNVPVQTKRNKRQPRMVMAGDCNQIILNDDFNTKKLTGIIN